MKLTRSFDTKLDLPISPLIDVVFLLLIYFMVTASLIRKEADLGFTLPTPGPVAMDMPVELYVEIAADGTVLMDGMHFSKDDRALSGFADRVKGLRKMAAAQQSEFFVNIVPNDNTLHGRVVDVMDACAEAGVKNLGFSESI